MNRKGFVLAETLVVTIFVLVIFTVLYNSAVPLLGRYNELSYYDDLDTTYDLYHYQKLLGSSNNYTNILNEHYKKLTCDDFGDKMSECSNLDSLINKSASDTLIYLNTDYLNELENETNNNFSDEIKDYLKYLKFEESKNILLLEHNGYISYIEIGTNDLPNMSDLVLAAANEKSLTCPTKIVEDDITYISRNYGCINFNYVWYSGKMWRITAIYPDGSMKLVTDSLMTTISYNTSDTSYTFDNSVIYQWLNEDFLDGIYNEGNGIIDTTKYWNATAVNNYNVKPAETDMVSSSDALVGLLNTYEYYKSFQNASNEKNGYLYNGLSWWKLNENSGAQPDSSVYYGSEFYYFELGVRPAIYLNSSVQFKSGTGSKSDPYIITGDKEVGQANDLVNTRIPGEYVKFRSDDGGLYRIVSVDNSLTKLFEESFGLGYYPQDEISQYGYPLTMGSAFGNQNYQASYVCGDNYCPPGLDDVLEGYYGFGDNYDIYGRFNYTNKLAYGDYYMGEVPFGQSYKLGVCTTDTSTTKNCTKADSVNLIAGILRYGELFAAYSTDGIEYQELYTLNEAHGETAEYTPVWLMTPVDSSSGFWSIENGNHGSGGYIGNNCTSPEEYDEGLCSFDKKTAFATIYLKSTIKIVSGSGTKLDPYIIT